MTTKDGFMSIFRTLCILIAMAALAGGCSSSKGNLTVTGDQTRTIYAQSFNQAYITASQDGVYDIILLQDTQAGKPVKQKANKPLEPLQTSSLRQIVHIHIFWQAMSGSVAKDGVVTNAAIDWYVIGGGSDKPEVLRYEGAGYVVLDEGGKGATVDIRDGMMRQTKVVGDLHDPIGPSRLVGKVKATRNAQFVQDTLAELKAREAKIAVLSQSR
jgi:hypothetical protein